MEDWTRPYFDSLYLRRWSLGLPDAEDHQNVDAVLQRFRPADGEMLLDVGCGQGRHSLAFAQQGIRVVGLDPSPVLLREGRRLAHQAGLDVWWIRGDMRRPPLRPAFDFAVLFDAFGFFATAEEDGRALCAIAGTLRPAGALALLVVNGERIIENFRPSEVEDRGKMTLTITREFNPDTRVLQETVCLEGEEDPVTARRFQRLYSGEELRDLVRSAGFTIEGVYDGFGPASFDRWRSPKCLLIARKA